MKRKAPQTLLSVDLANIAFAPSLVTTDMLSALSDRAALLEARLERAKVARRLLRLITAYAVNCAPVDDIFYLLQEARAPARKRRK